LRPFRLFSELLHLNRSGDVSPELRSKLFGSVLVAVAALVFIGIAFLGGMMDAGLAVRLAQGAAVVLLLVIWWLWRRANAARPD